MLCKGLTKEISEVKILFSRTLVINLHFSINNGKCLRRPLSFKQNSEGGRPLVLWGERAFITLSVFQEAHYLELKTLLRAGGVDVI